ncbi:MAG: hypothetical protein KDC95_24115, partial [Planctomycetes bacterium]|nr:hypothetical protein [Planctomycetota bacterium]
AQSNPVITARGDIPLAEANPEQTLAPMIGNFVALGVSDANQVTAKARGVWSIEKRALLLKVDEAKDGGYEGLLVFTWLPEKGFECYEFCADAHRHYKLSKQGDGLQDPFDDGKSAKRTPPRFSFAPFEGQAGFSLTVSGALGERQPAFTFVPDASQVGPYELETLRSDIAGKTGGRDHTMQAIVALPKRQRPDQTFPLLILSPGGNAERPDGYLPMATHFASQGMIAIVVGFNNSSAEDRAELFKQVLDWAHAEHAKETKPEHKLSGMIDTTKTVAAGHSRGGYAAIVAGQRHAAFTHVLALAPSGPEESAGDNKPNACVIVGSEDDYLEDCAKAYSSLAGKKIRLELNGMDHFFYPRPRYDEMLKRGTAFLHSEVLGNRVLGRVLSAPSEVVKVESATPEPAKKD